MPWLLVKDIRGPIEGREYATFCYIDSCHLEVATAPPGGSPCAARPADTPSTRESFARTPAYAEIPRWTAGRAWRRADGRTDRPRHADEQAR